jgi:hypothetical protein
MQSKEPKLSVDDWLAMMPDDLLFRIAERDTMPITAELKYNLLTHTLRTMGFNVSEIIDYDGLDRLHVVCIHVKPLSK